MMVGGEKKERWATPTAAVLRFGTSNLPFLATTTNRPSSSSSSRLCSRPLSAALFPFPDTHALSNNLDFGTMKSLTLVFTLAAVALSVSASFPDLSSSNTHRALHNRLSNIQTSANPALNANASVPRTRRRKRSLCAAMSSSSAAAAASTSSAATSSSSSSSVYVAPTTTSSSVAAVTSSSSSAAAATSSASASTGAGGNTYTGDGHTVRSLRPLHTLSP